MVDLQIARQYEDTVLIGKGRRYYKEIPKMLETLLPLKPIKSNLQQS